MVFVIVLISPFDYSKYNTVFCTASINWQAAARVGWTDSGQRPIDREKDEEAK
jgi:hypothetical protein